jgi:hypothetical protein
MSEASTDSTPHVPLVHGPQRGAGIASDASSEAQSDALSTLPPELRERCRLPHARACTSPDPGARGSTHVLYWVHHALRVDENPALEVASSFAAERGLPLLVCATVSTAHRPLTDRHVGFFLEGLREFAIDLQATMSHSTHANSFHALLGYATEADNGDDTTGGE